MVKNHIKRIAAQNSCPIKRKITKWITKQTPGPHKTENSLPMGVLLKEMLGYSTTTKETKYILSQGKILVNGKVRKDKKFPVGIMDVLTADKDNFRIMIDKKGKLVPVKISTAEIKINPKRVIKKTTIKGNKIQVNFLDGTNLLSKEKYSTGDTIVFSDNKVKEHLKFEKGALIYILAGKKVGHIGAIKEIIETKGSQPTKIIFTQGKENFETLKKYVFVIGKTKPIITLPNE
ncbi:30S ribosomal protein S4e [archaeon]|nr:30S ribosomal protein S4e [archaeon]